MRWSPKPCGSIDRACGHARRGVGGGMVPFSFAGEDLLIMGQGALFWPARKALLIADLHLEKASFFARFGQMLPPYDSNATLAAIEALVDETGARELWCLGDSFHDGEGPFRLDEQARRRLLTLTARLDWTWITGNHDPLTAAPGGRVLDEACLHGICLRHETLGSDRRPEISGHCHPRVHGAVAARSVRPSPCRAAGAVFQGDALGQQVVADTVGLSEVLRPAGFNACRDHCLDRFCLKRPFGRGALEPGIGIVLQ